MGLVFKTLILIFHLKCSLQQIQVGVIQGIVLRDFKKVHIIVMDKHVIYNAQETHVGLIGIMLLMKLLQILIGIIIIIKDLILADLIFGHCLINVMNMSLFQVLMMI